MIPRRVVTLPPGLTGGAALAFAEHARRRGADLLEVRTDLHPGRDIDAQALRRRLPLLVARRAPHPIADALREAATVLDLERDDPDAGDAALISHHAPRPLSPSDAVAGWVAAAPKPHQSIKHVEPLGSPADAARLIETQRRLIDLFDRGRVTVLATGADALPFRCVLAERNGLDYLAASPDWQAAPGQRLLDDAVRATGRGSDTGRLGILGEGIAHSRSPRIHDQPFDRIDLSAGTDLPGLLDALRPWYRGFAVTAPFKREAAAISRSALPAVNTLVRTEAGWAGHNTDVDGAEAVLEALGAVQVTVLGDGGATAALRLAAERLQIRLDVRRRQQIDDTRLSGPIIWTWPPGVGVPEALRFADDARVALIAYGAPARAIAPKVRARGGRPVHLGPKWFVAQARAQRELWRKAA